MAKSKKKETSALEPEETSVLNRFAPSRQHKITIGVLLVLLAIALAVSFASYFVNGKVDQSEINDFTNRNSEVQNWLVNLVHFYLISLFTKVSE